MGLLPEAARIADEAAVYDNSSTRPVCIAEKTADGRWHIHPQGSPGYWTEDRIRRLLGIDGKRKLWVVTEQ